MKKMIAILFALATVCVLAETAQSYAVFEFRATLKRIEPVMTSQKATGVNPRHLSYTLTNDTIRGFVVLPECCDAIEAGKCTSCGDVSNFGCDESGEPVTTLYIYRQGEKNEKATLVKVPADEIFATVFGQGANSAYIDSDAEDVVFKKLTKSSLTMKFSLPEGLFESRPFKVSSNLYTGGMRDLDYGFLGYTCLDGEIIMSGFGTAKPTVKTNATYGYCESTSSSVKCLKLQSVTGNLVGKFNYGNTALCLECVEWSLTDPCFFYAPIYASPVTGTWTLRYNQSLSGKKITDESELEAILLKAASKKNILDAETLALSEQD